MILLGQNVQLYVGGKSIAFAKNSTIDITVDTVDISTKDSGGYEAVEAGLMHWSMTSENLLANKRSGLGFDEIFDLVVAKTPVDVVFGVKDTVVDRNDEYTVPETGGWPVSTKQGYKGKALITSLSLSSPNGEASSMNVTLTGCSTLQKLNTTAVMSATNDAPGAVFAAPATSAKK